MRRGLSDFVLSVRGSLADRNWAPIKTWDELVEIERSERFRTAWAAYLAADVESLPEPERVWFWWMRRQRTRLWRERAAQLPAD